MEVLWSSISMRLQNKMYCGQYIVSVNYFLIAFWVHIWVIGFSCIVFFIVQKSTTIQYRWLLTICIVFNDIFLELFTHPLSVYMYTCLFVQLTGMTARYEMTLQRWHYYVHVDMNFSCSRTNDYYFPIAHATSCAIIALPGKRICVSPTTFSSIHAVHFLSVPIVIKMTFTGNYSCVIM